MGCPSRRLPRLTWATRLTQRFVERLTLDRWRYCELVSAACRRCASSVAAASSCCLTRASVFNASLACSASEAPPAAAEIAVSPTPQAASGRHVKNPKITCFISDSNGRMPGYLYDPVPLLERAQRSILAWRRPKRTLEDRVECVRKYRELAPAAAEFAHRSFSDASISAPRVKCSMPGRMNTAYT